MLLPCPRCHPDLLTLPVSSSLINLSSSLAFGSVLGRDWSGVAGEEIICSLKATPGVLDVITCLPSHPTWQTSGKGCLRASLGALLQPHVLAALFTSSKTQCLCHSSSSESAGPLSSLFCALVLTSFHQTFKKIQFSSSQRTDLSCVYCFLFLL